MAPIHVLLFAGQTTLARLVTNNSFTCVMSICGLLEIWLGLLLVAPLGCVALRLTVASVAK